MSAGIDIERSDSQTQTVKEDVKHNSRDLSEFKIKEVQTR